MPAQATKAAKAKSVDTIKRETLQIVGSTTVYPFAHEVAQHYAQRYHKPVPVIGTGGSGDGLKAFCAGIGFGFPDIANASRAMKLKEWKLCQKNGVENISEVKFGSDGIALVTSHDNLGLKNVTLSQLYKAIAQYVPIEGKMVRNPYRTWQQIDPSLPDSLIQIYGPEESHGTYGVILKKVIKAKCKKLKYFTELAAVSDEKTYQKEMKRYCSRPRYDGSFISLAVDNRRMMQMLKENRISLFFMGYFTLFKNRDKLKAIEINGVEPRIYTISDKSYVLSRPLFFYIKNAHRKMIPDMNLYVKEFMSAHAMDTFGYLTRLGLGGLPIKELKKTQYLVSTGSKIKRFYDLQEYKR